MIGAMSQDLHTWMQSWLEDGNTVVLWNLGKLVLCLGWRLAPELIALAVSDV